MLNIRFYRFQFLFCISCIAFTSCKTGNSSNNANQMISADSLKRIEQSTQLQRLLFQDTIPLDSIQAHVDMGTDLNIAIPFNDDYYLSRWDENNLLYRFWGTNHHDRLELTSLQAALFMERGNMEDAVLILLKGGADPNIITSDSIRCLDRIIYQEMDERLLDTLMAYGADPKLVNLSFAWNKLKIIDRFIKLGADPKSININAFFDDSPFNGFTYGSWRRDFNHVMRYDINPQLAKPNDLCGFYNEFNRYAVDRLIEKGLDLNAPIKDLREEYWLDWVLNEYNEAFTKYLIKKGAHTCRNGKTAYELALENEASKSLLDLIEEQIGK